MLLKYYLATWQINCRTCEHAFYKEAIKAEFDGINEWNRKWTFAELLRDVKIIARGLISASGLQASKSVAIFTENCPEALLAVLGVIFAGGISCSASPENEIDSLLHFIKESR